MKKFSFLLIFSMFFSFCAFSQQKKVYKDVSQQGEVPFSDAQTFLVFVDSIGYNAQKQQVTFKVPRRLPKAQLPTNTGPQGAKGDKGDKGDTGSNGVQGAQGIQGIQGAQGIKSDKGDTGNAGANGAQGVAGVKGDKGDTGATGTVDYQILKDSADAISLRMAIEDAKKLNTNTFTSFQNTQSYRDNLQDETDIDLNNRKADKADSTTATIVVADWHSIVQIPTNWVGSEKMSLTSNSGVVNFEIAGSNNNNIINVSVCRQSQFDSFRVVGKTLQVKTNATAINAFVVLKYQKSALIINNFDNTIITGTLSNDISLKNTITISTPYTTNLGASKLEITGQNILKFSGAGASEFIVNAGSKYDLSRSYAVIVLSPHNGQFGTYSIGTVSNTTLAFGMAKNGSFIFYGQQNANLGYAFKIDSTGKIEMPNLEAGAIGDSLVTTTNGKVRKVAANHLSTTTTQSFTIAPLTYQSQMFNVPMAGASDGDVVQISDNTATLADIEYTGKVVGGVVYVNIKNNTSGPFTYNNTVFKIVVLK